MEFKFWLTPNENCERCEECIGCIKCKNCKLCLHCGNCENCEGCELCVELSDGKNMICNMTRDEWDELSKEEKYMKMEKFRLEQLSYAE